jgi:hypothetical protein
MNDSAKPVNAPITDLEQSIDLEIEELEKIVAPCLGIDRNHNETLVGDEDSELDAG